MACTMINLMPPTLAPMFTRPYSTDATKADDGSRMPQQQPPCHHPATRWLPALSCRSWARAAPTRHDPWWPQLPAEWRLLPPHPRVSRVNLRRPCHFQPCQPLHKLPLYDCAWGYARQAACQAKPAPLPAPTWCITPPSSCWPSCSGRCAPGERHIGQRHLWTPGGVLRGTVGYRVRQRGLWSRRRNGHLPAGAHSRHPGPGCSAVALHGVLHAGHQRAQDAKVLGVGWCPLRAMPSHPSTHSTQLFSPPSLPSAGPGQCRHPTACPNRWPGQRADLAV